MERSFTAGKRNAGTATHGAFGPRFFEPPRREWNLGSRTLDVGRPRVMGILNLTPDSFSDGGELDSLEAAIARARRMVEAGADLLDVGGESTRPGAEEVPADEELRRILPFLREAAGSLPVPVSVDTRKAEVARAAVEAGATIVNDVSGLRHDPEMASFLAGAGVGVVLMHMRGTPADMRSRADYDDVVGEVRDELASRMDAARSAGIPEDRIVVDPGIGFAKDAAQSYRIVREMHRLLELGPPLLVGPSRKSFLGRVLGTPPRERVEGTVVTCALAYLGGARIFRVHDVEPVVRGLAVARAVASAGGGARDPEEGRAPGEGEEAEEVRGRSPGGDAHECPPGDLGRTDERRRGEAR